MTRLPIAASGTGGHLFPALAVAEAVEADGPVLWLGVPDRLETSLVPERFGLITVRRAAFRAVDSKTRAVVPTGFGQHQRAAGDPGRIDRSGIHHRWLHRGPAILAARWCGIPVVLHESNAIPGASRACWADYAVPSPLSTRCCPRSRAASRSSRAPQCAA